MDKLSGLILDYYDDGGALLTGTPEEGLVKHATLLSSEERSYLPDDLFALVDTGKSQMRKFAMATEDETKLSVAYFLRTGHRLPLEVQKLAAANLLVGCDWYDVQAPELLTKVALGTIGLVNAALMGPGAVRETKANLQAAKGAGGIVLTPAELKARRAQQGV